MAVGVYFRNFVQQVDGYGMPARFLRLVGEKYTFGETSGISNANPVLNIIDLDKGDLATLKAGFRPGGTMGESSTIQTLYHEATHAYLDLKENETKFAEFIRDGIAYYKSAPLAGGRVADDPGRIFQEAAASYVGHRAATWYQTYDMIERLREDLDETTWSGRGDRGFYDRMEKLVAKIPAEYDKSMRDRVFGYQEVGWPGFKEQVETTRAISARIKLFCDDEILENKISDTFAQGAFLKGRHDSLVALIAQSRTLVPVDVIGGGSK